MLVSVGPNLAREGSVAASEIFINQITSNFRTRILLDFSRRVVGVFSSSESLNLYIFAKF